MKESRYKKFTGIILNTRSGDNQDKLLIIFTKEYGKIQIVAKGARNSHSKFASATEPGLLCYGMAYFKTAESVGYLQEMTPHEQFIQRLPSYTHYLYQSYFLELTGALFSWNDIHENIFITLQAVLLRLHKNTSYCTLLARIYEWKLIEQSGIAPDMREFTKPAFDLKKYELLELSSIVHSNTAMLLLPEVISLLQVFSGLHWPKLETVVISDAAHKQLSRVLPGLLIGYIGREPRSYVMIQQSVEIS